jgi:hypothetical protein
VDAIQHEFATPPPSLTVVPTAAVPPTLPPGCGAPSGPQVGAYIMLISTTCR